MEKNEADYAAATHVALTVDGIRFVVDRRKTGWRFDCEDRGKVTKSRR